MIVLRQIVALANLCHQTPFTPPCQVSMNTFTVIFLFALLISYGLQFWLSSRQKNHVLQYRDQVPVAFRDRVPLPAHQRAAD